VAQPWQGSTRRQRLPANWASLRRHVLERDAGVCHVCGLPGSDEVDHVVAGDNHDESNLAAIHSVPCHRRKTVEEREAARPKRRRPPEGHPGLI